MKAMEERDPSEKRASKYVNLRFCNTFTNRLMVCNKIPDVRCGIVSSNKRLLTKATMPINANAQKIPLHDMIFNKKAPNIGATAGEISLMDWTIAKTDSRFLPLYTSFTMANAIAPAALPPIA